MGSRLCIFLYIFWPHECRSTSRISLGGGLFDVWVLVLGLFGLPQKTQANRNPKTLKP